MRLPALTPIPIVSLVAIVAAGACSLAPAARPTPSTGRAATPIVTLAPTATVSRAPATPRLTPPEEIATTTPRENTEGPPAGYLRSGDQEVAGHPGSYCYGDTCADIGGWPAKSKLPRLTAGDGDLEFSIADDVPFVTWIAASGATSNDDDSTRLGKGGFPYDPDANTSPPPMFVTASIPRPPAGDWVVFVWVDLEFGDLSYAWHVLVP